MLKFLNISGIIVCFILTLFSIGFSESITVTTYYPSPYASYDEIRVYRMTIGSAFAASAITDGNLLVSGNVGIGVPTINAAYRLEVGGEVAAPRFVAGGGAVLAPSVLGVSSIGTAVQGSSSFAGGAGIVGTGSTGVYGEGSVYNFFAGGAGVDYATFTGAHEVVLTPDFPEKAAQGMVVSVTGESQMRIEKDGQINVSATLPTVKLSNTANDKTVFGAFVLETSFPKDHWYKDQAGKRYGLINALGDGRVWVSNINGDIAVGDYITTSSIPGYGQKQKDDLLHSYTLAKVTESVDWAKVKETVQVDGKKYKVYLIGVTYTSG